MRKSAVSVTLSPANLAWLRGLAARGKARSVSAALDELLDRHRLTASARKGVASVRGTIRISPNDPALETADEALRQLFPSRGNEGAPGA